MPQKLSYTELNNIPRDAEIGSRLIPDLLIFLLSFSFWEGAAEAARAQLLLEEGVVDFLVLSKVLPLSFSEPGVEVEALAALLWEAVEVAVEPFLHFEPLLHLK